MTFDEAVEIQTDILEALVEIGSLDKAYSFTYKKRLVSLDDKLYKENVSPVFKDTDIYGLLFKTKVGYSLDGKLVAPDSKRRVSTAYIVAKSLSDQSITPLQGDKLLHNGVLYLVQALSTIIISNMSILYKLELIEDEHNFQLEKTQEELSPEFEVDVEQDVESTNDTGVNDLNFKHIPARVIGGTSFVITADLSSFQITSRSIVQSYTFMARTYTVEEIEALINTGVLASQIIAYHDADNRLIIDSVSIAPGEFFNISGSVLSELGITEGVYRVTNVLDRKESSYDINGEPKWT